MFVVASVQWGDLPTWIGGVGTAVAVGFTGVQLRSDRRQREQAECQRRRDESQRRAEEKAAQLSSVQEATAALLGVVTYISMLTATYGIRRSSYEQSWSKRPGRAAAAVVYGPRLITDLVATTERLVATYHRIRFLSTNTRFVEAIENLVVIVNTTVADATGKPDWDRAAAMTDLDRAAKHVLELVPHSI